MIKISGNYRQGVLKLATKTNTKAKQPKIENKKQNERTKAEVLINTMHSNVAHAHWAQSLAGTNICEQHVHQISGTCASVKLGDMCQLNSAFAWM